MCSSFSSHIGAGNGMGSTEGNDCIAIESFLSLSSRQARFFAKAALGSNPGASGGAGVHRLTRGAQQARNRLVDGPIQFGLFRSNIHWKLQVIVAGSEGSVMAST